MTINDKLTHSFEELNTHVIDKALFGQEDRILAIISWLDMYEAKLKVSYKGAIEFMNRYLFPHLNHPIVFDFIQIMPDKDMKHDYDNAFRLEVMKNESRYDEGALY